MTSLIIKSNVEKIFTKKILFIVLIFSLYAGYLKGLVYGLNITYWEFVIYVISDHYYFLYFLVVTYIFLLFHTFKQANELIQIRSRRYINYFMAQIVSLLVISTLYVLIHVLVVAIVGLGLSLENSFTDLVIDVNSFVVVEYKKYFSSPLIGSIIVSLYLIFGLTFLGATLLFLKQLFSTKTVIFSILSLYFFMLLSIRTDIDAAIPFIFLNNYIVLHHAFDVLENFYFLFILTEIVLIGIMCLLVQRYWSNEP